MERIDEIIRKFKAMTKSEYVSIFVMKGETTPFESSFGGTPYLPNGFEYPYASDGKTPMQLLAQINFEDAPHLENFPEKGILQIFIDPTDELFGMDFDNPTGQKNYRIFYHADVDKAPEHQQKMPAETNFEDSFSPVFTPLKLDFKLADGFLVVDTDGFTERFIELYNKETGSDFNDVYDLPKTEVDKIFDELSSGGHKIGGSPSFTQSDPREYDESLKQYSTLLLQIDSEMRYGKDLILWGDCGVGNFFIKPEDLKNCKFDDVLYNWDCY